MRLPRLTYANVVATLALFLALGGAAYAATQLPANSVGTRALRANSVVTGKLRDGAVTESKLSPGVRKRLGRTGARGAEGAAGSEGRQGPEGREGKQGPAGEGLLGGEETSLYVQNGFTGSFTGEIEGDEKISFLSLAAGRYEITGKIGAEAKDEASGGGELWCGIVINEDEIDASAGAASRGERLSLVAIGAVDLEEESEVQFNCVSDGAFVVDPNQTHLFALPVSSIR